MSLSLKDNKACLQKSLITLTEAVAETRQSQDKILRLASNGMIDLYCQFGLEKIEFGALSIAPTQDNPVEWPANNCQNNYAQALSPYAEMHLQQHPDYFVLKGQPEYPENLTYRLQPRQIRALLANKNIYIKHGWLPTGAAFKVVEPPEGMEVSKDGLLISTYSNWFKKNKRQQQISDSGQAQQQEEVKPFIIPQGTEWYEIRIHFVDTGKVLITIGKKGRKYERNYKSIDCFVNQKTKNPTKGWLLLFTLACCQGALPPVSDKENGKRVKQISLLKKNLMNLFPGVDGNPFKAYTKGKGWEPRITLSLSESLSEQYRR